jgi:hypothetical protein
MDLKTLCWFAVGWAASSATLEAVARSGRHGPDEEEQVCMEMRSDGHDFGLKAAEACLLPPSAATDVAEGAKHAGHTIDDNIRLRAAWWSDSLRHNGINPRLSERFVTVWAAAAHEASRERLARALR